MTDALSARQIQVLKAVIDEYIKTAEPVGSESLEKKYDLGVSPATIRNEMSALTSMGYLRQPHTSAGRSPAPKAMKFYISQLMQEQKMSLADEVKVKQEVMEAKDNTSELLDEATHELARLTKSLAVATLSKSEKVWHSGYSNVFDNPEFTDFGALTSLFSCLEEVNMIQELFFERMRGESPVEVLFGEELGWPGFAPIGVVGVHFNLQGREGALGVIGPARLPYYKIIPVMRYFRDLIQQAY